MSAGNGTVSENGNGGGDVVKAGWGDKWISLKGPVGILLLAFFAKTGLDVFLVYNSEQVRRAVEQEARLEISVLKARQDVIVHSIARYCGVPDLAEELRRIEADYQRRRAYINELRDKAGVPRIGAPPIHTTE